MILASVPFFSRVLGFLQTILDTMTRSVSATISALKFLAESIPMFHTLVQYMPLMVATGVTVVVALAVVKLLIGR